MEINKLDYRIIVIVMIYNIFNSLLANYLFATEFLNPINYYTNEIINGTLVVNLIGLTGSLFIIFIIGKHNLASIWFSKRKLKIAILLIVSVWIISQVFIIAFSYYTTRGIIFIQNFNVIAGNIIGQFFGNSLLEEMIFRGILLIQLYLIFITKNSNKITIIYSLATSAIIFVLIHIPNRILTYTPDNLAIDTMSLLFGSTLLGIIFLKTKNLPFVIGFHSLVNDPSNIIVTNIPTEPIIFALVIIITLKWDKIIGKETEYLLPIVEPLKV